jgi:O-antigen/teichoic acid export membrane protein
MLNRIKDSDLKELLKGSSIAFIFKILGMGLGYIFILIIAQNYGAGTVGLFTLSLTVLNIFTLFAVFGFENALVKFVAQKKDIKDTYKKALSISIPLGILLSISLYISSEFLAITVFKNESLTPFLQIVAFAILPFTLIKIDTAIFRGLKNIKLYSFFQNSAIFIFAIPLLLLLDFDNLNSIYAQTIAIFIVFFLTLFYIFKNLNSNREKLEYSELLNLSFPMLLTASMAFIMAWTDIIMLGIFRSEEEVGIYAVVLRLANLTTIFLFATNSILAPKFSELYKSGNFEKLRRVVQNSTKIIVLSSLPIVIILILFPNYILSLFGEEFILGVTALWILMIGKFINVLSGSVGYLLNMTNFHTVSMKIDFIIVIINVALNYILIPNYGLEGAAIATAISISLNNLIKFYFVKKEFGFYTIGVK